MNHRGTENTEKEEEREIVSCLLSVFSVSLWFILLFCLPLPLRTRHDLPDPP